MSTAKISDVAIISTIALLAATLACIDMPGVWDSTQSGKFIVFSYVSTILFLLISIRGLYTHRLVVRLNKVDVLLLLFLLATLLNRSIKGYGYSTNFYELPGLILVYIAVRSMKATAWLLLFLSIMAGGVIQAVYGLLQFYHYMPSHVSVFGICGGFFNPGPYAGYLASAFPVLLGYYLREKKFVLLIAMAVVLLALSAALSRAAWLAVLISSIFLLSDKYNIRALFKRVFDSSLKAGLGLTVALMLLIAAGYFLYSFKQGSADGRLLVWKVTLRMFADNPVSGVGPDRFVARYMDYQQDYFHRSGMSGEALHADNIYYAFNDPLQFVAENGLIGLSLLTAIVWSMVKIRTSLSPYFVIAGAGLLSVAVFSLFSYPMDILPIKLNFVIFLSVLSSGCAGYRAVGPGVRPGPTVAGMFRIGAIVVLIVAAFRISGGIRRLYDGYSDWQTAMFLYQEKFYGESVGFYKKAYPVLREDGDFLTHYGKALSMGGADTEALDKLHLARLHLNTTIIQTSMGDSYKSLKMYDSAEIAYLNASYMLPDRIYPKYLLAKLYAETGQKEKAVTAAREILRHPSRIPSDATDEIDQEMLQLLNQYRDPK